MNSEKKDSCTILGENIRYFRIKRNMSQDQLAKAVDVSVATLSSYETGKTSPSIETTFKISQICKITLDQLYLSTPNKNAPYNDDSES